MKRLRNLFGRSRVPAAPGEAAVYWCARRELGLLSHAEEQRFEAWRNEASNQTEYDAVEIVASLAWLYASDPDILEMRKSALAAAPYPSRSRPLAIAGLAAVVAVLVALGIASYWSQGLMANVASARWGSGTQMAAPLRYITKTGETRAVRLEDGSVVTLNTASVLEVDFTPSERDVRLVEGQALFQVAKAPARPFVVSAGDRRIIAVGTAFDVRVEPDRVAVVLVRGHVVIDPLRPSLLARIIPGLDSYGLSPGQEFVADGNAPVAITTADTERLTSWQKGQIIFRDSTIADAVEEMDRYSNVKLIVDDPRIATLRISGVFKTTRLENFIAALEASYPITTEKRSPLLIALVQRN